MESFATSAILPTRARSRHLLEPNGDGTSKCESYLKLHSISAMQILPFIRLILMTEYPIPDPFTLYEPVNELTPN